jgi:hypothetical protein
MRLALLAVALILVSPVAARAEEACGNASFRIGLYGHLPDCRAYEQVSPSDKNGLDATPDIEQEAGFVSALPAEVSQVDGGSGETSIAYRSLAAYAGSESSQAPNAYLATRRGGEWHTQTISPPTPQPGVPAVYFSDYNFAPDLSRVVVRDPLQRLTEGASEGVVNLYLRKLSGGSYTLVSAPPLTGSPTNCAVCTASHFRAFSGASDDFQHILFEANDALILGVSEEVESLYESVGGKVALVGILPDGAIASGGTAAGAGLEVEFSNYIPGRSKNVNHAISQDGSRVFFRAAADGGSPDPAQLGLTELYERVAGSKTVEISVPAKGAVPANPAAEPAWFWTASANGELVFFTSSAELTTNSNTGLANASEDLYRYNTRTEELTDLTVDSNPMDGSTGARVLGVIGSSSDGSYVYFAAAGQLVEGEGVSGQPNLYLAHENQLTHVAEISFVTTLNSADEPVWTAVPSASRSYVTPDGLHLAFTSINRLTGYDNEDQNVKGRLDSEVYEYSAKVHQSGGNLEDGHLVCVSCDLGAQRPVGNAFIGVEEREASSNTPFYKPRVLSDDGSRLFFSSPDRLLPGLASPLAALFEYENGVVHLLASPSTGTNDLFLDASPSGNDVFFATRDRLVPSDEDNLVDVYDARVGGGLPGQAEPATAPALCASACQGQPSAPPLLPTATSTLSSGSGNLDARPTATHRGKHKPRRLPRRRRRAKARRHVLVRRSRANRAISTGIERIK